MGHMGYLLIWVIWVVWVLQVILIIWVIIFHIATELTNKQHPDLQVCFADKCNYSASAK